MAKIVINRASSFIGCAVVYDVWLVNKYVGKLHNGEFLEIPIDIGIHRITFSQATCLLINNQKDVFFDVVVNNTNETVALECKFKQNGLSIKYADNAPHIPTFSEDEKYDSTVYDEYSDDFPQYENYIEYDDYQMYCKNTVTCRTCGAKISPRAKVCPYCGEKPLGVAIGDGISSILKAILMLPLIIIAILIAVSFYSVLFY